MPKSTSDCLRAANGLICEGNKAFRAGHYEDAILLYKEAAEKNPGLLSVINFNIAIANSRINSNSSSPITKNNDQKGSKITGRLPITVLIITWDIGHNPLGRSYMLAEVLDCVAQNVVLTGFQFERYGKDIWSPVKNGRIPVIPLKGKLFPDQINEFEKIIKKFKPDIVFSCKPRLPSLQLGLLFKEKYRVPLILDIDDYEMSFIKDKSILTVDEFLIKNKNDILNEVEPYSDFWTRLSNDLVRFADKIVVSNCALQGEFGGVRIPHVRNEEIFDPHRYDKEVQRNKYGIPINSKVVMFFGTPRHHKGVGTVADAVGRIKDPQTIFVVVGEAPDKSVTEKLYELSKGKIICLPNQPFSAIPEIITMADIVCLPQDENHDTSKYQLPAKAIDAVAMGIPLLVSKTEPLMELVNDGLANLIDNDNLAEIIEKQLASTNTHSEIERKRSKFLNKYSYGAASKELRLLIEQCLKENGKLEHYYLNKFVNVKTLQRMIFNPNQHHSLDLGKDIVLFWKQNDTNLYGRRHDMLIRYLESRADIRKVVVFDFPISEFDLNQRREGNILTQDRNIYIKTYLKLLGQLDTEKVKYNVFVYKPGKYTFNKLEKNREYIFPAYKEYLEKIFSDEGINPRNSVFWFFPKNYLASEIIDYFSPGRVVVDVVDDHRAWPNISAQEKETLTRHYRDILSRADFSLANCQPVIDSMKKFSPLIRLIPNGCEDNPKIIEPINSHFYEELKNFNGKTIGFVGNLEAKIDIDLIEKLAHSFPKELIVLVGSTHANPEARELIKHDNIRMAGVVDYEYINAIVSKFSIAIVPHKKMPLTENMNPLKIFIYLANRIPVVSTDVSNLPDSPAVLIANNHEDFIEKCKYAIKETTLRNEIDTFIKNNSWKKRFKSLIDEVIDGISS